MRPEVADIEAAPAPVRPSGRRALIERLLKIAFGVAVVAFGVDYVVGRRHQLGDALSAADARWIAVAALFAIAGQWAAAAGFRAVLAATSSQWLPVPEVSRVFFVSQLGKYIPGSVWPIVAVTTMCRRHGIGRSPAAVAGLLALAFSLLTGGLVGIVLVLASLGGGVARLWWLALLVPIGVLALHPRVVVAVVNTVLRLARRQPITIELNGAALRGALLWPCVSWLFMGLQCWALVVALGGPVWGSLAGSVGGFALAYTAGTLFVPAPAGAGVREAVLGVSLAGVINGSSAFGHNQIVVVVLLSRVLLAALDFAQAGGSVLLARSRRVEIGK